MESSEARSALSGGTARKGFRLPCVHWINNQGLVTTSLKRPQTWGVQDNRRHLKYHGSRPTSPSRCSAKGRGRQDEVIWLTTALGEDPTETQGREQVPVPADLQEANPRQGGVARMRVRLAGGLKEGNRNCSPRDCPSRCCLQLTLFLRIKFSTLKIHINPNLRKLMPSRTTEGI